LIIFFDFILLIVSGTFLTFIERLKAAKIKYGNMEGYFWLMVKNRTIAFLKKENLFRHIKIDFFIVVIFLTM